MSDAGLLWPHARLGEAAAQVCAAAGLGHVATAAAPPPHGMSPREQDAWWQALLQAAELEAEPIACSHAATEAFVASGGPALVAAAAPPDQERRYLAILGARLGRVAILTPAGDVQRLRPADLRGLLWAASEAVVAAPFDALLDQAELRGAARTRARDCLLSDRLGDTPLPAAWLLRLSPAAAARRHLARMHLARRAAALVVLNLAITAAFAAAWVALGRGALTGRVEFGWFAAFALLFATILPLRWLQRWLEGLTALDLGARLKRRLLLGSLRVDPDTMRPMGAGQLLARVLESEVVEAGLLAAGFAGVTAVVETGLTIWVLARGPAPAPALLTFALFAAIASALSFWNYRRVRVATATRLDVTHDLVERLLGHRTRAAQETPAHWHDGEDDLLAAYLDRSAAADRASVGLSGVLTTAWLVAGLAAIGAPLLDGTVAPAAMAVGIGGLLLAQQALVRLANALAQGGALAIAWQQVRLLYRAAATDDAAGIPDAKHAPSASRHRVDANDAGPLLACHRTTLRYPGRAAAALAGCDLTIRRGDRVLVAGPSGGGKSTLVQLLLGLRAPTSGTVLLDGLDRQTLGAAAWRARVTGAPQFHTNHVYSGTLAFNLLLGRDWPAATADLAEAEQVCRELGLGALLDRMPGGLQQTVGETGWQLSHGEKSRVFLARALLQGGDVFVFDESFAALDPETLCAVMPVVQRRAPTMVVVAHP